MVYKLTKIALSYIYNKAMLTYLSTTSPLPVAKYQ